MAAYESIFILRPELDDEAVAKVCDRLTALVADHEGSVIALEKMGKRRLSYEVKGQLDGYYVILNYDGKPGTTTELERNFKISDEVLRYIIVKREVPYKPATVREPAKEGAGPATPGEAPEEVVAQTPKEAPVEAPRETAEAPKATAEGPAPEAGGPAEAGESAGDKAAPAQDEASEAKPE